MILVMPPKDRVNLSEEEDAIERAAAYDEVAGDAERSVAIETSVLTAVEHGLL